MRSIPVLVAGGGISGLSIARSLAERGISVEVWEKSDRLGGKIQTDRSDGYITERAASMVFNYQPTVARFLEDSGIAATMEECRSWPNRYIQHAGGLEHIAMKFPEILKSSVLSRRAKLRLMLEPFVPRREIDGETISEFVSRRLGREFLEKMMEPLVGGTLASDPDKAEIESVFPRLKIMERKFGSFAGAVLATKLGLRESIGKARMFSFKDGMSGLVQGLAAHSGIRLRSNHRILSVDKVAHGWHVTGECDGEEQMVHVRVLVMSVPAPAAASLLQPFDFKLANLLEGICYASIAVVHAGFARAGIRHPLDGNGFLVPRSEGTPVTGCLWMSSVFGNRAPDGDVLLTSYISNARVPDLGGWDDDRTGIEALNAIAPLLGISRDPKMLRVDRHKMGLPLYYGAYGQRLEAINTCLRAHPGLFLEANYRGGVSVRDRLMRAGQVARDVAACLECEGQRELPGDFSACINDIVGGDAVPQAAL